MRTRRAFAARAACSGLLGVSNLKGKITHYQTTVGVPQQGRGLPEQYDRLYKGKLPNSLQVMGAIPDRDSLT